MALSGNTRLEQGWNFLIEKGLTKVGAAGLIANLDKESGLIPTNLENSKEKPLNHTDASYTKAVDDGTYKNFVKDSAGYGIAQWTFWSRKQNLYKFMKERNLSIGDYEGQLEFLYHELSTSYKSVLSLLKSTNNVHDAAVKVLTDFEAPYNVNAQKAPRYQRAEEIYNQFAYTSGKAQSNATMAPTTLSVGEVVSFNGTTHYASSQATTGVTCKPGKAKVTQIAKNTKHPYHLVAEAGGGSTVWGWVDANTIGDPAECAVRQLADLKVINSPDFWLGVVQQNTIPGLNDLIVRATAKITKAGTRTNTPQEGIDALVKAGVLNATEGANWKTNFGKYQNVGALLQALGGAVTVQTTTVNQNTSAVTTEDVVRAKLVACAKGYLGYNEYDGSHKKIIDGYNEHKPLAVGYKVTYTDAWCATFVSFVSIKMGFTDIMPTECSCTRMIALYQKLGRWHEDENYVPKPGDVIFYDWQDGANFATTDNKGVADHVGIVVSSNGRTIEVIEGNKSNSVSMRTLNVNGRYIRGYGLPDFKKKTA